MDKEISRELGKKGGRSRKNPKEEILGRSMKTALRDGNGITWRDLGEGGEEASKMEGGAWKEKKI